MKNEEREDEKITWLEFLIVVFSVAALLAIEITKRIRRKTSGRT